MKRILFVIFCLVFAGVALAKEAQPNEDPQIEQRMKALTEQLRCLVCQNETLADSRADLAEDLRKGHGGAQTTSSASQTGAR